MAEVPFNLERLVSLNCIVQNPFARRHRLPAARFFLFYARTDPRSSDSAERKPSLTGRTGQRESRPRSSGAERSGSNVSASIGQDLGRDRFADAQSKPQEDLCKSLMLKGIRAIGQGPVGVGVHFEEQGIAAGGDGRPGQGRDHLALARRGRAAGSRAGKLDRMRGVEDHRCTGGLHLGDRPEIVDQPAVAEGGSALGQAARPMLPTRISLVTTLVISQGP